MMSWKHVFNSTVGDKYWGYIDIINQVAKDCGYKFFTWNGYVWNVDGEKTDITVEELI
jgi:hypothetical protein